MIRPLFVCVVAALLCSALPVRAQFGLGDPLMEQFKAEAEQGDAEAQFQYGLRLLQAKEGRGSKAEGAAWVQKAAKQGHVQAMHAMGLLYEAGEGVEEDVKKAAEWYGKAADEGLKEAQWSLAILFDQGRGVEKDASRSAELAMMAAMQGHAPSQAFYGVKLVNGDGVKKNPAKAAVWFLKAAQQDNGFAQRQLAYLYYTGNGVPMDYARCEAWYRRAATNDNDVWAQNDLAWFLATCPDSKFHNGEEAVAIVKSAVRTLQESDGLQRHEMLDTMAAALARNNQFGEALIWQRRCIALLKEDKDLKPEDRKKLETEFQERLQLYTDRKAYSDKAAKPEAKGEPLPNDDVLTGKKPNRMQAPQPSQPSTPKNEPEKKKKKEAVT